MEYADAFERKLNNSLRGRQQGQDLKDVAAITLLDVLTRWNIGSLTLRGRKHGHDFKNTVAAVRRLTDCYPQAHGLKLALSNGMVNSGVYIHQGTGNIGDSAHHTGVANGH